MGAPDAGYVLLRLPLEVRELFADWLRAHYPGKLEHVPSLLRSARGGKLYDPGFGARSGSGPYAWMIGRRFEAAAARHGLGRSRVPLRCDLFRPPASVGEQLHCFEKARKIGPCLSLNFRDWAEAVICSSRMNDAVAPMHINGPAWQKKERRQQ
jgi:hypothetical protein